MSASKFDDLTLRTISGAIAAIIGIGALYLGGAWMGLFVLICALVMVWETYHITNGKSHGWAWFIGFSIYIILACYSMYMIRTEFGFAQTFWIASCVVASDIGGYFGGRLIGGPKFWPKISPKKTWSGTIVGWILAGLISSFQGSFPMVIGGMLFAFAAQMGDILESTLKRRFNVKDSSQLIPGHGGFLDRLDGMMGAFLFAGIWFYGSIL